ncbi:MAG TPA: ferritin family protein [Myxococcales bacterium]|nr:ferritin family protein [Myxococcales bacterium]
MAQTIGIDFEKLDLKDALDLAVLVEEEARERYEEFADQMAIHRTASAERFFRGMARNEEKHRAQLWERRRALFGDSPAAVSRAQLFDVEAPEYDEVRASMTAREALHTALRAERKAWDFFDCAIPRLTRADVRELFEELRGEEAEHQRMVLAEIDRTPPDPAVAADFDEDEPVAQ